MPEKLISELIHLPERVRKGDFVVNLSKGVTEPLRCPVLDRLKSKIERHQRRSRPGCPFRVVFPEPWNRRNTARMPYSKLGEHEFLLVRKGNASIFELLLDHDGAGLELATQRFNLGSVCAGSCQASDERPLRSDQFGRECPGGLLIPREGVGDEATAVSRGDQGVIKASSVQKSLAIGTKRLWSRSHDVSVSCGLPDNRPNPKARDVISIFDPQSSSHNGLRRPIRPSASGDSAETPAAARTSCASPYPNCGGSDAREGRLNERSTGFDPNSKSVPTLDSHDHCCTMESGRATSVKSRTNGSSGLVTVCSRNRASSSVISLWSYGSIPIRPASVQNACSSPSAP